MQTLSPLDAQAAPLHFFACIDHHFGGDQSPLNDADADEDTDPEGYLDLDVLGLDEFSDSDKLDPIFSSDVGSSSVN
ncbi:hypothetical protein [Pseudomonas caspiana]|uniref:hypothetical protein n=1 Tax=Pseudomonas caspiana TaxID=1451454 RepID=UPI0032EB851E